MNKPVLYDCTERVARLTLNRPASLNSLDLPTVDALIEGAKQAVADGAAVLVIAGTGRAFCSGADLSGVLEHRDADGRINLSTPMRGHYNPLVETLTRLPIPIVTAVNGVAAGGGVSLALCGDIVIAAHSASFQQVFCNIGLIPDMGATWFLPRLVGRARARGLAMLGDSISAATAKEWGLIWEVVDDQALMSSVHTAATRLSRISGSVLRAIRRALDTSDRFELSDQLMVEARIQTELGREPAFEESVLKFLQKKGGPSKCAEPEAPRAKDSTTYRESSARH